MVCSHYGTRDLVKICNPSATSPKTVRRPHECVGDAGFGGGVAGVGDDLQRCFGPGAVEVPCVHHRTDDVVTSMHDHAGDVSNAIDVFDQVIIRVEETVVHEVVTFDSRERDCHVRLAEVVDHLLVRQ